MSTKSAKSVSSLSFRSLKFSPLSFTLSSLPYFASAPAFQLVVRIAERMSGDGFASALPPPVLVHNARLLLVKLLERTRGTPLYATA